MIAVHESRIRRLKDKIRGLTKSTERKQAAEWYPEVCYADHRGLDQLFYHVRRKGRIRKFKWMDQAQVKKNIMETMEENPPTRSLMIV